jgi:hypothetical protein
MNSSAAIAKPNIPLSPTIKVVIPTSRPRLSNNPPPEDPGEIAADV